MRRGLMFLLPLVACGFTAEVGALRPEDSGASPSPSASDASAPDGGSDADDASGQRTFTVVVGPNEQKVFNPKTLTIRAGDKVQWLFVSSGHTLVAANGSFCAPDDTSCGSPPTQPRGSLYARTFTTPGTFAYQCSHHSGDNMRGTIIVEP